MILSTDLVDWALDKGANGLEIDVAFSHEGQDVNAGAIAKWAYHGAPCDCNCPHIWWVPLCKWDGFGGGGFPLDCELSSRITDVLRHMANSEGVGLIHLDNKHGGNFAGTRLYKGYQTSEDTKNTGTHLANMIVTEVFQRPWFGGDVVFGGSANLKDYSWWLGILRGLTRDLVSRTWLAWEVLYNQDAINSCEDLHAAFKRLKQEVIRLEYPTTYMSVRANGMSGCAHWLTGPFYYSFEAGVSIGVRDKSGSYLDKVFCWTVDIPFSMNQYLMLGVDALITNEPSQLVDEVRKHNRPLPTGTR
jgi:hypothetical protein